MRVECTIRWESSLSFSRTALSHTEPATPFQEQVISQFIAPYQTTRTLAEWTTISVRSPNSMSTSSICVQNVNELLDVWYGIEQSTVDSTINEWCTSL